MALARTDDGTGLLCVLRAYGPESNGGVGSRTDDDALVYRGSHQVHDFLSLHQLSPLSLSPRYGPQERIATNLSMANQGLPHVPSPMSVFTIICP